MSDRCEPPEGQRDKQGLHFLRLLGASELTPALWVVDPGPYAVKPYWTFDGGVGGPENCHLMGWRYLAPVTPPAEVERLRADLARLVEAARFYQQTDCPVCAADCAGANPPVGYCPTQALRAAIGAPKETPDAE